MLCISVKFQVLIINVDRPVLSVVSFGPGVIIRCKNLALYIRDCVSLCLSDETLKAVGPFYLVSMPGEVKDPTQGVNRHIPCRGLHTSLNHSCVSPKMGCLEYP